MGLQMRLDLCCPGAGIAETEEVAKVQDVHSGRRPADVVPRAGGRRHRGGPHPFATLLSVGCGMKSGLVPKAPAGSQAVSGQPSSLDRRPSHSRPRSLTRWMCRSLSGLTIEWIVWI